MKKFRKISALALTLVLVCLCAASAFAVTSRQSYMYQGLEVDTSVTAEDYLVKSAITVDLGYTSLTGHTQVTGYYYTSRYDSSYQSTTRSKTITTGNGAVASISFSEAEIFIVHKATGRYRPTINSISYTPGDLTAVYYTNTN